MNTPWIWWGPDPGDDRLHAVAACDIEAAPGRGWTESLCGWHLPVDVELLSEPGDGSPCRACHLGATADLQSSDFPAPAPFEDRP